VDNLDGQERLTAFEFSVPADGISTLFYDLDIAGNYIAINYIVGENKCSSIDFDIAVDDETS